jgi:hypothetical protein
MANDKFLILIEKDHLDQQIYHVIANDKVTGFTYQKVAYTAYDFTAASMIVAALMEREEREESEK